MGLGLTAPDRQQLGRQLRQIRHQQGRKLTDVAAKAHVSFSYLSEVERGEKEASSVTLNAICEALGVSIRVSLHQRNMQLNG